MLDESTRQVIGSMHPGYMGGEYLPAFGQDEIEIVRMVLDSTTQDVISIRARRSKQHIYYRVADEYETRFSLAQKWSAKPLSFKELISFIDNTFNEGEMPDSGVVLSIIEMNAQASSEPESLRDFICVSSDFYPQLGSYYAAAIDELLAKYVPEEEKDAELL